MKRSAPAAPRDGGRPLHWLLSAVLLWLWGVLAAQTFFTCVRIDATFLRLARVPEQPWLILGAALLPLLLLYGWRHRDPRQIVTGTMPLLLVIPFFYLPVNLWTVAGLALLTGWCGFRLVRLGFLPGLPGWCARHPRRVTAVVAAVAVALAVQAVLASRLAYHHLYLATTDWGTYAEAAYHTFHGRWFYAGYPEPCWSAGHFMPGFFLLAAPWFGLFPAAGTAFVLNGVLLFGSGILLYWLGRRGGIDPFTAGAAALVWLLHPSVSNLNLCNFYGFNGEYVFIPLFFLFQWCRERGHGKWAVVLAVLTLTLKETFAVFWVGWGLMQVAAWCAGGGRKRLWEGLTAGIAGGIYYWCCIRWIIPQGSGDDYIFFAQYAHLGNDVVSILLSPFLRPAAFWGTLIHPKNLFVLLLIGLPFLPGCMGRLPVLGAPFLLLGFHLLRNSRDVVNLSQHYQLTLLCCGAAAMLWGIPQLRPGGRIDRWLCVGFRPVGGRGQLRFAAALAALLMAVVCHWFFARSFYGPNSMQSIADLPDARPALAELRQIVPAGDSLAADEAMAGHFLFRNPVVRLDDGDPDADWALEVQGDRKSPDGVAVHAALLENPAWQPVWFRRDGVRKYYLFQRRTDGGTLTVPDPVPPPGAIPFFRQDGLTLWQVGNRIIGHAWLAPGRFAGYPEFRIVVQLSDGSVTVFPLLPGAGLIPLKQLSAAVRFAGDVEIPPGTVPVETAAVVRSISGGANDRLPAAAVVVDGLDFLEVMDDESRL